MNIIWSKKELSKIKTIILNRSKLTLDEENMLIDRPNYREKFEQKDNLGNSMYFEISEEIENLYYIQDRLEIERILTKAKEVQVDPYNKLHHGLIVCLSKANPENHTYVFEILKEIASQYERVIANIAKSALADCETSTEMIEKINKIITKTEETAEEIEIKYSMYTIFLDSNGIFNEDIFKPIIRKCNSLIKNRLIHHLNQILTSTRKIEEYNSQKDVKTHTRDFDSRYQRSHMSSLKRYNGEFY